MCSDYMAAVHKQEFEKFTSERYLQGVLRGSSVVIEAKADEVKLFLQGKGERGNKTFTHWVKQRGFQFLNYPALGLVNILCTPVNKKVQGVCYFYMYHYYYIITFTTLFVRCNTTLHHWGNIIK